MEQSPDFQRLQAMILKHADDHRMSAGFLVNEMIGFLDQHSSLEAALAEGIIQAQRGEGRPAREFMTELMADYGTKPSTVMA